MPYWLSALGLSETRTAGSEAPPASTWPTPGIWAIFCARIVEPTSYSSPGDRVSELSASDMIGACDGLILRYCGIPGMPEGSCERAALIAACTSRAASSTLRSSANCRWIRVNPWLLEEVIRSTPGMVPSARSSGVATLAAIDSGLAPGMLAETWMAG